MHFHANFSHKLRLKPSCYAHMFIPNMDPCNTSTLRYCVDLISDFLHFCTAREAPYAKARTHLSRDIQMTRHNNHGHSRTAAENGPSLLS
jgi:hypothetical protein